MVYDVLLGDDEKLRELAFFFFQAEDGIRDPLVTGVQTCALPIYPPLSAPALSTGRAVPAGLGRHRWGRHRWSPGTNLHPGSMAGAHQILRPGVQRQLQLETPGQLWRPGRGRLPVCHASGGSSWV